MDPKIIAGIAVVVVAVVVWKFITRPRPVQPFPRKWRKPLKKNVEYYADLPRRKRREFRRRMMEFLSRTRIEGVETQVEDLDRILIAASAIIPVFGFPKFRYNNLDSVLLYPKRFDHEFQDAKTSDSSTIAGMVGSALSNQMILSRPDLRYGFRNSNDKHNTAIHEFVHLVDEKQDLTEEAPPRIRKHDYATPWIEKMHEEMEAINNDESDIRKYAGTKKEEFLAVTSEYFFERPHLMKKKHPELYEMFVSCFQQDPTREGDPRLNPPPLPEEPVSKEE